MPKVKPFIKKDPLEDEIKAEIAAGMAVLQLTTKDLSEITGINYSRLRTRIGKNGDIKMLRIGELIKIRKALRR